MKDLSDSIFNIHKKERLVYLTIPAFDKTDIVNHCFSTKLGGISEGEFSTLNLGYATDDLKNNINQNYKLICDKINVNHEKLIFINQVHKTNIRIITKENYSENNYKKMKIDDYDGIVTNIPNLPITTVYADCVPLFFLDPHKKVVALAHAGWRGTLNKIGKKMIDIMIKQFSCDVNDILVGIGPSICKNCFEVESEVANQFLNSFDSTQYIENNNNGKYKINLWEINKQILLDEGIKQKNITIADLCTKCNQKYFFSYRGTSGKCGRLASIIELK